MWRAWEQGQEICVVHVLYQMSAWVDLQDIGVEDEP